MLSWTMLVSSTSKVKKKMIHNVNKIQIVYARAYTHEHQFNLLVALAAKMAEEPFRLLVNCIFSNSYLVFPPP